MLFALAAPFVLSGCHSPLCARCPALLHSHRAHVRLPCGREVCTRCAQGERAETDIRAHLEEEGWMAGCSCMVGDGARGISRDAERAHRPPSHLLSFRCASEGGGGRQLGRRAAMHALWLTCACLPAMPGNVLLRWQYICCTKGLLRLRESELVRFPRPRMVLPLPPLPLLPFSFNRYPVSSFSCLQLSARFYGHPSLEWAYS